MAWRFDMACEIGSRVEQQDRVAVFSPAHRPGEHLAVLADGMGGRAGGALAAQRVIDIARQEFARNAIHDPQQFLFALCRLAHRQITDIDCADGGNPGSTCTLLYLYRDEAYWMYVGDSRLYQFDAQRQVAHTVDHTVAELVREVPARNTRLQGDQRLYMCLGGASEPEPGFGASVVGRHHWFILCSDGFWRYVQANEVRDRLVRAPADPAVAAQLVELAARRAGKRADNISLLLVRPDKLRMRPTWWRWFGDRSQP